MLKRLSNDYWCSFPPCNLKLAEYSYATSDGYERHYVVQACGFDGKVVTLRNFKSRDAAEKFATQLVDMLNAEELQ